MSLVYLWSSLCLLRWELQRRSGLDGNTLCPLSTYLTSSFAFSQRLSGLWDVQRLLSDQSFIPPFRHETPGVSMFVYGCESNLGQIRYELHLCALDRALFPMQATPHGECEHVCVWSSHTGNGEKWHRHSSIFSPFLPVVVGQDRMCVWAIIYVCMAACVRCISHSHVIVVFRDLQREQKWHNQPRFRCTQISHENKNAQIVKHTHRYILCTLRHPIRH